MKKIALIFFSVLVLVSLISPFWVFSGLLFPFITGKAFFFRVVIELAFPFYIYLILSEKKLRPDLKNFLNLAVLFFLFINLVSAVFGVNFFRSFWGNFERMGGVYYLFHLAALFFYVQLLGQAGQKYLKLFFQVLILVASLIGLNGLSGWFGFYTLTVDPSLPIRASSTFGNPIFLASFLILPFFLSLYFATQEEKLWLKIIYFASAVIQLMGIYSSGTRGAVIGLAIGFLVGLLFFVWNSKNKKLRIYGIGFFVSLLLILFTVFGLKNHFKQGSTIHRLVNLNDTNTQARLVQWKMSLQGFKEKPLLGVGPENYYVIFSKYFKPEMYKYDGSWFDKPHNFLLEVLNTTGIFGLLTYLAMFVFCLWGFWKAYFSGTLTLAEGTLLISGMVVYLVQNLFVFDTVSPSIMFYAFLGFGAFLLSHSNESLEKNKNIVKHNYSIFAGWSFFLSLMLILYIQYLYNYNPILAANRVNMGFGYSQINAKKAAESFKNVSSVSFNLDPTETANKYSEFVIKLSSASISNASIDFLKQEIVSAIKMQRQQAEKIKNHPILWMRLAQDEIAYAQITDQNFAKAQDAADKAIALAPKRVDILQVNLQLASLQKRWAVATEVGEEIVRLNPYSANLKWQLALLYFLNDKVEDAVKIGDSAILQGHTFNNLQQFAWYIQYYQKKGDFMRIVPLLERATQLEPKEIGLFIELALAYGKVGENEKAKAMAEQVYTADPSKKIQMEAFIKSLK
jgi:O-antigen ligase/tetratricopeptide (TPR) repeat protein